MKITRIIIYCISAVLIICTLSLTVCSKNRKVNVNSKEILSVIPGHKTAKFELTVTIPDFRIRPYNLKIYDITFVGKDLVFADMNNGEWEYSMDGSKWHPLILTKGECILYTDVTAGKFILSLRATKDLDIGAVGGLLNYKLKLDYGKGIAAENAGGALMWAVIGITTGSILVLAAYQIAKVLTNKKTAIKTDN